MQRWSIVACVRMIIVVIVSIVGSGCFFYMGDPIPPRIPADISQVDGHIFFDLPSSSTPSSTIFEEIIVLRIPESKRVADSEKVWHMRMDKRVFKDDPPMNWPMRYGQKIANTVELLAAKKLQPGSYRVDLVVVLDGPEGSNDSRGIKTLVSDFSIDKDFRLLR